MIDVAIIGAGLAGTSCAYILRSRGFNPVIYESASEISSGASGNELGLYNPRFAAELTPESIYYSAAFFLALDTFVRFEEVDFHSCGVLDLMNNDSKAKRFPKMIKNWGWGDECMRIIDKDAASTLSGVSIGHDALYLPDSGMISPRKLCHAYAQGIEIKYNSQIDHVDKLKENIVILCNGMGSLQCAREVGVDLPLTSVRGQLTLVKANEASQKLNCSVCYDGCVMPAVNGRHVVGSTFQRWLDHTDVLPEDDEDNIARLMAAIPAFGGDFEVVGHRASIRTTSRDYFPLVGQIPGQKNLYISSAHGSHGIISSLMAAHVLADAIMDRRYGLPDHVIKKLSPARFL